MNEWINEFIKKKSSEKVVGHNWERQFHKGIPQREDDGLGRVSEPQMCVQIECHQGQKSRVCAGIA